MRKDDVEPKPSRAERTLQKMTTALRKECGKIREDLASAGTDDAKVRHRLGTLVKAIRNDAGKYGQRGVEQLAVVLGYDESLLYRHAKVVDCWSSKELTALLRRESVTGIPISFSHLQLIATVTIAEKRDEYIEMVLREGLSVRQLKRRLAPKVKLEAEASSSTPDAARALRGLRVASENWLERVTVLEAEVLPALESGPPRPELLPEYQQTLAQQQKVAERLSQLIARISNWIEPDADGVAAPARRRNGAGLRARVDATEGAQPPL